MLEPAAASSLRFSIVVAVHNAGRHLGEFIDAIEGQTFPREGFEVIVVDEGSTDGSLEQLREWHERSPSLVAVIAVNGTARDAAHDAARNAGLEASNGRWVTFPEPEDILPKGYLSSVADFLDATDSPCLIATNRLVLDGGTGALNDTHPLRRHFAHGMRVRDLEHYPDHFHESVIDAFFSLARIRAEGLRFDPDVGPSFSEAHFCAQYLLLGARPTIGFLPEATYLHRSRIDSGSSLASTLAHPQQYARVLRRGFLALLRQASGETGSRLAPEWLQELVLYELSWYLTPRDADGAALVEADRKDADEICDLIGEILAHLSRDVVAGFSLRPVTPAWRDLLLHAFQEGDWHATEGLVARMDPDQHLVKVIYRFTGEPPQEQLMSGGETVEPMHSKTRDIAYFGRLLMRERILWLSASRSVRLRVGGRDVALQFALPGRTHTLQPGTIRAKLHPREVARARRPPRRPFADRLIMRIARSRLVRHYFGNAWVLTDRITDAGDNAERLFRYLRGSEPRINAWFVVEGGSPDWHRLRRDGTRRVVPHGSLRWKLLMANCRHLISSHVSPAVLRPPELSRLMEPTWRFTFLQHGVIHTNLSRWLNIKPIDLFITSSIHEHASISGDHTPYTFTTKEVKLTGLPRWDRLREIASGMPSERRDLLLVMPTWRSGLVPLLMPRSQRREFDPAFFDSEYARNWMSLLKSEQVLEACARHGLELGFLPHPNVQPALPGMGLPSHVRPLTFADNDVQELFARAAVFVTDYSSVAFDAAYIDRPVVYFQFDRDEFLGGVHHGRRGYFEYERDGFGPVTRTVDEAVHAIVETLDGGRSPAPMYQDRIDATFPLRDGKCCERVVTEIQLSTRDIRPEEAAIPIVPPNTSE